MSSLQDIIESLNELEKKDIESNVAAKGAPLLQAAVEATLSAGTSPEGAAWAPRKKGGRAYANAASRITTKASGNLIRMTLTGPEVYGHFGVAGMPVRQMIPDAGAGIPASVTDALTKAATQVFEEATK